MTGRLFFGSGGKTSAGRVSEYETQSAKIDKDLKQHKTTSLSGSSFLKGLKRLLRGTSSTQAVASQTLEITGPQNLVVGQGPQCLNVTRNGSSILTLPKVVYESPETPRQPPGSLFAELTKPLPDATSKLRYEYSSPATSERPSGSLFAKPFTMRKSREKNDSSSESATRSSASQIPEQKKSFEIVEENGESIARLYGMEFVMVPRRI